MKVHGYLARQSKPVIITTGFVVTLLIGTADHLTGHKISPSLFYLVPIITVTWFAGKRAGIATALFNAATLLTVELLSRQIYPHPAIPYLNLIARSCVFLAFVVLLSAVQRKHENLEAEVAEKTASLRANIEEHVRVEEALRASEERIRQQSAFLEKIIDSLGHPFYVIDTNDYTVILANSASCLKVGGGQDTCFALTHRQDRPCSQSGSDCPLEMVKKTKKLVTVEHTHYDAEGHPRSFEVHASPILDAAGNVVQMIEYSLDITERKRAEKEIEILNTNLAARAAELEAANRELEAFNYTVSHDLRKPLTTINGYCQAIVELHGAKLDEQGRMFLREIYEGSLRMNTLIETLLEFSHLTRVELHLEKVDLSGMAKEVAAELKMSELERRVTFRIAEGIEVDGDANLLRVVLGNLLGNAWKYNGRRDDGVIEFGKTSIAGKPACFVRDNGVGFDMAHAEHLFMPFQRAPGAATSGIEGYGIGLATVQRIIERHGGKVWAEGEVGKGAVFYFSLWQSPDANSATTENT